MSDFTQIDWDDVETKEELGPVPKGEYTAAITVAEERPTKSGGQMVTFCFQVIDGPCKNRNVWHNANLVNASTKAQQIGRSQIRTIFEACGMSPKKSLPAELVRKTLCIKVDHEESEWNGKKQLKAVTTYWKPKGAPLQVDDAKSSHSERIDHAHEARERAEADAADDSKPAWGF